MGRDYWTWCEAQFDTAQFRHPSNPFKGFYPNRAKCASDKCIAEVEVAFRAAGRVLHPQALLYATKEDMATLVTSLPASTQRSRLAEIGHSGITLTTASKISRGEAPDRGGTLENVEEHYP